MAVIIGASGIEIKGPNISGNHTRNAFSRFSLKKKNSCTRDVANDKGSATV
jgi:hypothetical protein